MTLTRRSSLGAVALAVGGALRRHGIRAVLTGGACASLHTRGGYEPRNSLAVAVAIGLRNRIRLPVVERWSAAEGFADGFAEFLGEVRRARVRRRRRG